MQVNNMNTLFEELYGNVATLFHRFSDIDKIKKIFNGTYKNYHAIDFDKYNGGIYTTIDMDSQLSKKGLNNMQSEYGDKILKLAIKDIDKFMFVDFNYYKKYNKNANIDTFIEEQLDKFKIKKYFDAPYFRINHVYFSKVVEQNNLFDKVAGVIYHGNHDGDCCLIYNNKAVIPISISIDDGKTWTSFKDATNGISKEERKNRFDAYKKGFSPEKIKEEVLKRNKVPNSIIRKALLSIGMRILKVYKTEITPNARIYYTLKKTNSGGDKYSFYTNNKLIGVLDYDEIIDPLSGKVSTFKMSLKQIILYHIAEMLKYGEYNVGQKKIEDAKEARIQRGYDWNIAAYINKKYKKQRGELKLESFNGKTNEFVFYNGKKEAYNEIGYKHGELFGKVYLLTPEERKIVKAMIESAIEEYKKVNKIS